MSEKQDKEREAARHENQEWMMRHITDLERRVKQLEERQQPVQAIGSPAAQIIEQQKQWVISLNAPFPFNYEYPH